MKTDIVFISSPLGTFTPTNSGAIATIMWECYREAVKVGRQPAVIARRSDTAPYEGVETIFVDYPPDPTGGTALFLARMDRRFTGWTYLNQRIYARRVVRAIRQAGLSNMPMVLWNDPELAVLLRQEFPNAFLVHWFQNQLSCKARAHRRFAASVNAACGVSDFTSRWVEAHYGFGHGTVKTLYNAVDCIRFQPAEQKASRAPVVNFVGRTGIEKGPDLFLRSALRLARKTNRFSVQMLGSNHWGRLEMDDFQRELKGYADELEGLGIPVRRPGHIIREALPGELRKADINVVPSRWDEPFGLVTLEGMASGLATIASRTGGTPEVTGDAALLFERDSEEGLAGHMERLVSDDALRAGYGRRARSRAEEFSWTATWNRLQQIVEG